MSTTCSPRGAIFSGEDITEAIQLDGPYLNAYDEALIAWRHPPRRRTIRTTGWLEALGLCAVLALVLLAYVIIKGVLLA